MLSGQSGFALLWWRVEVPRERIVFEPDKYSLMARNLYRSKVEIAQLSTILLEKFVGHNKFPASFGTFRVVC